MENKIFNARYYIYKKVESNIARSCLLLRELFNVGETSIYLRIVWHSDRLVVLFIGNTLRKVTLSRFLLKKFWKDFIIKDSNYLPNNICIYHDNISNSFQDEIADAEKSTSHSYSTMVDLTSLTQENPSQNEDITAPYLHSSFTDTPRVPRIFCTEIFFNVGGCFLETEVGK